MQTLPFVPNRLRDSLWGWGWDHFSAMGHHLWRESPQVSISAIIKNELLVMIGIVKHVGYENKETDRVPSVSSF